MSTVYSEQTSFRERTDARISRSKAEIKDLQKAVGTPDAGLKKQVVDLSLTDQAEDEKIKTMLGRLDELESQLRTYWKEMRGELKELKKAREAAAAPAATEPAKADPEELYKQGFDAFQKGAYNDAIPLFAEFVKQSPADAPLSPMRTIGWVRAT